MSNASCAIPYLKTKTIYFRLVSQVTEAWQNLKAKWTVSYFKCECKILFGFKLSKIVVVILELDALSRNVLHNCVPDRVKHRT